MSKKLVAGITAIVIVAVFLVLGGLWYMRASSHKEMCMNWYQQNQQRKLDLDNNYGLLTSAEQRHDVAVQVDSYNAECSPGGATNYANSAN
jgi:hypothetical protein